jgi:hypothetical protein
LNWTDAADAMLVKLWDSGASLGYVADGLCEAGYVVSRNSVAGRKHRLTQRGVVFRRVGPSIRTKPLRPINQQRSKRMGNKATDTPVEPFDHSTHEGVEYLENIDGCKAILGKRGGAWMLPMVCGRKKTSEVPYCNEHLRMYTNQPRS